MLLTLWSPKGGSGTSVFAAACALVLARHGGVRLVDLAGDQPAIFGLGADPDTGVADWLAAGPEAPTDALDRLAVEAAPGVALVPRGTGAGPLAPLAAAEAGAALAVALRDGPVPTSSTPARPDGAGRAGAARGVRRDGGRRARLLPHVAPGGAVAAPRPRRRARRRRGAGPVARADGDRATCSAGR